MCDDARAACSRRSACTSRRSTASSRPSSAAQIPGAAEDPRFWATGISLIAHPRNPNVPAVHMNTRVRRHDEGLVRRRRRPDAGAGCARTRDDRRRGRLPRGDASRPATHDGADYPRYKDWCDDYFWLPHRNEPRGDRRDLLRQSRQRRLRRPTSPSPGDVGRGLPRRLSRTRAAQFHDGLDARPSATSNWSAGGAMSSSTCCTTAARCSG